ncbi:uncharacterized protein PHA67_005813 [Liasis olivaceus]
MEERRVELLEEVGTRLVALVQSAVALKEDLQVELDCVFAKDSDDQGVPQEVSSEGAQPSQVHLPPLYLRTSQVEVTSEVQPGNCQRHPVAMLDAILKNQEALRMVLTNQDTLKNLVDQLQNTVSAIEDRIRAIEQQMGAFAQFTKEINQLADETNWG